MIADPLEKWRAVPEPKRTASDRTHDYEHEDIARKELLDRKNADQGQPEAKPKNGTANGSGNGVERFAVLDIG